MFTLKPKYPISKEFFPFDRFTPPISPWFLKLAKMGMKVPGFIWKDKDVQVVSKRIPSYNNGIIEIFIMRPKSVSGKLPCLMNFHGGGFVLEGAASHYQLAMAYAKKGQCVTVYVKYRLAPDFPFPYAQEDCFNALCWVYDHAEELGIDKTRMGVSGDSAGGALSVLAAMMVRDRRTDIKLSFQMLIYPWLDGRNVSDSYKKYTDTPMWNSTLSNRVGNMTNPEPSKVPRAYASPVEADDFSDMPPAYIEVAEFDCLHDDGVYYNELLEKAGIQSEIYEVKGTMHGFDTKFFSPTSQKMVEQRGTFIRKMFY